MKNCPNCGTAKNGLDKFCLNCGYKFEDEEAPAPANERKEQEITPTQRKKRIALLTTLIALILALGATHLYLQAKFDVSKSIVEMNQAYTKNDAAKFLSYFTIEEGVITDEKGFYSFVESEGWESIRDQLKAEANLLKAEDLSDIILDSNGNKFVSVVNEPVLFGLYDRISFLVHPIQVQAEIPMDKASIEIGDQTLSGAEGETKAAGKFLPGNYQWKASADSEYSPIENTGTANVVGDGSNSYLLTAPLEAGMIKITSDVADAVLWVNGKSTGKTVKEMNSIGPIPFDGSVEISAESKDDKDAVVKGKPVSVKSATAHITFAHVQEKIAAERDKKMEAEQMDSILEKHAAEAANYINNFRSDFEMALNSPDFSYISGYFAVNSQIQKDYIAEINRHAAMSEYYYYEFISTSVTDIQAVDLNTIKVYTTETFNFMSGTDDLLYDKKKVYTIEVNDDMLYLILDIEQTSSEKISI